jgi:hypothetical protein
VDIRAVITETEGMADDEPCDALGSRIAVAKTPATAKTAPTASQEARHLNIGRDPESTGTTPLCPPTGEARTRSNALSSARFIPPRGAFGCSLSVHGQELLPRAAG